MRSFGVPERFTRAGGIALPIAEIVIAVLLIPAATARWGALLALILLAVFVAGISYSLSRGRKFDCHCFGQLTTSEIGPPTLIRNAALAVLAAFVTISGFANNDPGPGLTDVFRGLDAFEWVMLAIVVILLAALAAVAGCSSIFSVRTGVCSSGSTGSRPRSKTRTSRSRKMMKTTRMRKRRVSPSAPPRPRSACPGLYGETMTLDSLRAAEKPVLLIFTDPSCGPCNAMMGDVGKWQRDLAEKLTIAVISRGFARGQPHQGKAAQPDACPHAKGQRSSRRLSDLWDADGGAGAARRDDRQRRRPAAPRQSAPS